ncbi:MAG: IclR family transcriptional regulator [Actinomycetales bacterium]|nr:MAG: IclR family transcriptional regulator [Actinomycetales bacterium]
MDAATKTLRALRLLGAQGSLGVSELAGELDVASSSAHRILGALRAEGFAVQQPGSRRYVLGPAADELGPSAAVDVVAVSRPHLVALWRRTGETAHLVTVTGDRLHFLDGVESSQRVRVGSQAGEQLHAATTAGGKALLATRPDHEVRTLLGPSWSGRTTSTIRGIDALLAELAEVRRVGHAENREESVDGVYAVGAAAVVTGRVPVAVTVSAPTSRAHGERLVAWSSAVRDTAATLGAALTRG